MISFLPSDHRYPFLEHLAIDIADIIHSRRGTIVYLNEFLSRTGTLTGFKDFFPRWKVEYLGRKPAPDKVQFVTLLEQIPTVCNNIQANWEKLRGIIAEKIFEKHFSQKHPGATVGYGVIVAINSTRVLYSPSVITDDDKPRRTVDAGSWNDCYGEFVEVKIRPDRFQRKDIKYLELLEQKLNEKSIDHKIFLVSFEDTFMLRKFLLKKELIDKSCEFELISHEDFLSV